MKKLLFSFIALCMGMCAMRKVAFMSIKKTGKRSKLQCRTSTAFRLQSQPQASKMATHGLILA